MIRVLLVDDEAPARERLKRLLGAFPDLETVGEAENGLLALESIEALRPDVIFLDIDMPELGGLEVARTLGPLGPAIVFVTAYDEHALKAFEASAVDYLVKPVIEARLKATVEKVRRTKIERGFSQLLAKLGPRTGPSRLAVRIGQRYSVFSSEKISAILSRDHYSALIVEGRELLADDSLNVLETRLNPEAFLRIHRSAIINLEFLSELEYEGDRKYVAVLSDLKKTKVSVSREKLGDLKLRLGLS